jgi:hypothetical protein
MSYYYKKEYFKSIKTATKACEVGDYKFALTQLINALDNLNKIDAESDELLRTKAEVNEEIHNIKKMQNKGDSFLIEEIWQLTKSSFVLGKKCIKSLYLESEKKSEKTPFSKEKLALLDRGRIFENKFRENEFPAGINISKTLEITSLLNSYTIHLLNSPGKQIIFEATIIENDVLIMCDVLIKNENGRIDVYECKFNKEINIAIREDLSLQYTICRKRFGDNLNSFNLVLRADDEGEEWVIHDLTEDLANSKSDVDASIQLFKEIIKNPEPSIDMGDHCDSPYECGFKAYCSKLKLN